MDHRPQAWGRPRDDVYGQYDPSYLAANEQSSADPTTHTQSPIVTGTSVIAIKFKDGVVMAADNLASYGSLARFPNVQRLIPYAPTTILGFSGDISDMQHLTRTLTALSIDESYDADTLEASNLHRYLSKLLYYRRSKFNPLWNAVLVAGFDDGTEDHDNDVAAAKTKSKGKQSEEEATVKDKGKEGGKGRGTPKPFLASVDLLGTTFTSPSLATGFGAMLAQPILRKHAPTDEAALKLTREQAIAAIKECMKVLFYRDARSMDRYSLAVVTKEKGVELTQEKLEAMSWKFAERIRGYGTQTV